MSYASQFHDWTGGECAESYLCISRLRDQDVHVDIRVLKHLVYSAVEFLPPNPTARPPALRHLTSFSLTAAAAAAAEADVSATADVGDANLRSFDMMLDDARRYRLLVDVRNSDSQLRARTFRFCKQVGFGEDGQCPRLFAILKRIKNGS